MRSQENNDALVQLIFFSALLAIEMIIFLSNDMFLPAVNEIAEKFTISIATAQQSVTLWFAGSAILQLLSGPLDERFGHKKTLIAGILNFSLASLLCFYAEDYTAFSIGRFLEGASVGLILTAGYSLIHETNNSVTAIKIISIMRAFSIIPAAIGPTVGGVFLSYFDWRLMFLWFGLLSFFAVGVLYFYTPKCEQKLIPALKIKEISSSYMRMLKAKKMIGYTICSTLIFMLLVFWIVESVRIIIDHEQESIKMYGIIQCSVALMLSVGSMFAGRIGRASNLKLTISTILGIKFLFMLAGYLLLKMVDAPIQFSAIFVGAIFLLSGVVSEIINRLAIEHSPESVTMSNAFIIAVRAAGGAIACVNSSFFTIDMKTFFAISAVYTIMSFIIFASHKEIALKHG